MNPTGTNSDGGQTAPTVDDCDDDLNLDGEQHTPLPTVTENDAHASDHHPEGEHDPNQRPDGWLVMCRARLGPKTPASAQLYSAQA